jgi:tetratricopeptide (TPR) repeat protein
MWTGCAQNTSQQSEETADSLRILSDSRDSVLVALSTQISNQPQNVNLLNQRAQYYIEHQNLDSAYKDLAYAFTLDSLNPNLYVTLHNYFVENKEPNNAMKALDDGLKKNPNSIQINMAFGKFFYIARKHDLSFKHLNNALKSDKYLADAYFYKALNYRDLLDTNQAIGLFQTAIEQNPKFYEAYMQLGLIYSNKQNPLAKQYFTSAIQLQPKNMEARYAKAYFMQIAESAEMAKAEYKSMLRIDSTYTNAWYNLGYIAFYEQKLDSAKYYFNKTIDSKYDETRAYYMRGLCYEQLGDRNNAVADYKSALKLEPNYPLAKQALQTLGE